MLVIFCPHLNEHRSRKHDSWLDQLFSKKATFLLATKITFTCRLTHQSCLSRAWCLSSALFHLTISMQRVVLRGEALPVLSQERVQSLSTEYTRSWWSKASRIGYNLGMWEYPNKTSKCKFWSFQCYGKEGYSLFLSFLRQATEASYAGKFHPLLANNTKISILNVGI